MLKYGVDDIRLFYENDLRFLEQFPADEGPALLAARVRRRPRHAGGDRRDDVGARLRRRRHRAARRRRCACSTSRSPPTGPTACRSSAWRARWRRRIGCRCEPGTPAAAAEPAAVSGRAAGAGRTADIDIVIENPDLCPRYVGARRRRHRRPVAGLDAGAAAAPPASARSATSSTSPTTCCSSSASRCTRSIYAKLGGARDSRAHARAPARRCGRSTARRATLTPEMLVIADAERAVGGRRRHGRRRLGSHRRDDDDRLRERLLQPAVGAAHEQEARAEDRSEHALRARRRSARCR